MSFLCLCACALQASRCWLVGPALSAHIIVYFTHTIVSRELIYSLWGVGPGGGREPPFLEEGPQDTSREDLSPEDLSFLVSHSR